MAHSVTLNWSAPTTGDPVVSYDVKRAPVTNGVVGAFASIASPEPTTTTYVDTAVVAGQEYAYEVCSVNASGESVPCPDVLATIPLAIPQPPTNLTAVVV
jgi:fibronectin type 3 domain-containing protein